MNELFEIWHTSQKASQIALDQQGRHSYPVLGVVSSISDPENARRVKVSLPSSPGIDSDWLRRLQISPFVDPPLPTLGQTVLVLYAEGIETNGYYLNLVNDTNPPLDKSSNQKDYYESIPGNKDSTISGDETKEIGGDLDETISGNTTQTTSGNEEHRTDGNIIIEGGQSITLKTDSGSSITLSAAGYVEIVDALGRRIRLGGAGGINNQWDLAGYPLTVVNSSSFTINGKEVAVVGATDSRGDTVVTRGY